MPVDLEQHRRMWGDAQRKVDEHNAAVTRNFDCCAEEKIAISLDKSFSARYRYGAGGKGSADRGSFNLSAPWLKSKINGKWVD